MLVATRALAIVTALVLAVMVLPTQAAQGATEPLPASASQGQLSRDKKHPTKGSRDLAAGLLQTSILVEERQSQRLIPEVAQRLANGSIIFAFCARQAARFESGRFSPVGAEQLGILTTASGMFAVKADLPADVLIGLCALLLYAESAGDVTAAPGRASAVALFAYFTYAAVYARMAHILQQCFWITDVAVGLAVAGMVAVASRWAAGSLAWLRSPGIAPYRLSSLKPQVAGQLAPPFEGPVESPAEPKTAKEQQRTPQFNVNIEHLEPADIDGMPNEFFRKLVKHQTRDGAPLSGRIVARPPESAMLGAGSFGQVWRARHISTGTLFAVKNLDPRRSERECDVVARLAAFPHPCVVKVFSQHRFEDVPLLSLVMNLCTGDLSSRIRLRRDEASQSGQCYAPPPQAVAWVGQILLGLEHLHLHAGTILMDLKPANVLLDSADRPQLADFGLACVVGGQPLTEPAGTPGYVAPEVLLREAYDWHADFFALGALLWVLLEGGAPGQAEPVPPNSAHLMRSREDHAALQGDWLLLQAAAASAAAANQGSARAGMQLVTELTARQPKERPGHDKVRASAYLAS